MTLGFICEELKDKNLEIFLDSSKIEEILKGILLGLNKNESNFDVKIYLDKISGPPSFSELFTVHEITIRKERNQGLHPGPHYYCL